MRWSMKYNLGDDNDGLDGNSIKIKKVLFILIIYFKKYFLRNILYF